MTMQYYCIGCVALMGLFFTLFYIFTAFIGPQTIFGELAEYHIQIVIALITLACSLPSAPGTRLLRMPHPYALVGLCSAVFLSLAFNGWIGGGPIAMMEFVPNAMAFFFVVLNCKKKIHLQLVVGVLFLAAFYTIFQAWYALHIGNMQSPYLLTTMTDDSGENQVIRIIGLSFISDPNDLSQFLVGLVPCLFFFWGKGRALLNFLFVYVPIAILIFGMYLTHSRGAMVALLAVAIVAGRRRIGVVPAVIAGVVLFAALSASGWSGGRDISAANGEDRMDAWGVGLGLIRTHPLFGVGYRRFSEFNIITAHNTVVVCAAELGLVGFFFWMLFVLPTIRDIVAAGADPNAKKKSKSDGFEEMYAARAPQRETVAATLMSDGFGKAALAGAGVGQTIALERSGFGSPAAEPRTPGSAGDSLAAARLAGAPIGFGIADEKRDSISDEELRRLAGLMIVSFAGFLTAGWFLSRAYVMTLFVNAGIAEVIYRMARERGIAPEILPFGRAMKLSILTCIGFLLLVYLILRVDHFLPQH